MDFSSSHFSMSYVFPLSYNVFIFLWNLVHLHSQFYDFFFKHYSFIA